MEFGKVPDLRGIDLSLPPDHPANAAHLARARGAGDPLIRIGCPVWNDDGLARNVCPPGTPKGKRLSAYARQFDVVEVNATGYGINPDQVRQWADAVPSGFRFCPKVPRDVSLALDLDTVHDAFARACAGFAAFGDKLGRVLLQFPESFGPARFPQLERLLAAPRPPVPLAVEVRHLAWFSQPRWRENLFLLLESHGIPAALVDTPGRRDAAHMRLSAPVAYVRVNGHDGGAADLARMDAWAERAARWLDAGLRELWFIAHVDPVSKSADLAARFLKGLKARTGLGLREPVLGADLEEPRLAL
jgi:uncharacterized protein YecE (DUF72 family)